MNIRTAAFHCRHYKGDVKKETVFFFANISHKVMLEIHWLIVVVTETFIDTLFYNISSKLAMKRLEALHICNNMVHWAF